MMQGRIEPRLATQSFPEVPHQKIIGAVRGFLGDVVAAGNPPPQASVA